MLHRKQMGNLGEMKVAAELIAQGYYVFTELGDICKSDLVILNEDYNPIKVQVKTRTLKNGVVSLKSSKHGPNYSFAYETKHADIYAIYIIDLDTILYVSNKELLAMDTLTIRIDPTKSRQKAHVNWAKDYTDFKKALRDSTCNI